MTKRQHDFLSKDQRQHAIREIIGYFENERDEEIGIIAAEQILDFMLITFGEQIYKKAIEDTKKLFQTNMENLTVDLDMLVGGDK
jgi:uncharacterized protein (DUF2164 family)